MKIKELNGMSAEEAATALQACCGSTTWVQRMVESRPFASLADTLEKAHACWAECSETDALEAFRHHPKIGDVESLAKKFAATAHWAGGEQASVQEASKAVLQRLKDGNDAYERKFGYIFIVCATGKSAEEMLAMLEQRLPNIPELEIGIAMAEQMKITEIRLQKLLSA